MRRLVCVFMVLFAAGAAAATQHIEIYEMGDKDVWPFELGDGTKIWANGACVVEKDKCNQLDVPTIVDSVNAAHNDLGEPVGIAGTNGSATVHVLLHQDPNLPGAAHDSELKAILLAPQRRRAKDAIYHEMGHAFFDKHVGDSSCDGDDCTDAIVEHWGLRVGAKIDT